MSGTTGTIYADNYLLTNEEEDGQAFGSYTLQRLRDLTVSKLSVVPARSTKSANYTLALADVGATVEVTSASATTVTIPNSTTVAFPTNATLYVRSGGTGNVTIVPASGVTLTVPPGRTAMLAGQYSRVTVEQVASNVWQVSGDLQPVMPTNARRVADFLDTLGINTHIATYQTPSINLELMLSCLQYIGATAIRDSLATTADQYVVTELGWLAATGIKLCLTSPTIEDGATLNVTDTVTAASTIAGLATDAFCALEQPNEPNSQTWTYNGSTSTFTGTPGYLPVAQFMAALYPALKQNALLSRFPILHTTNGGQDPMDNGLQNLVIPYGYNHATLTTTAATNAATGLTFASTTSLQAGLYAYLASTTSMTVLGIISSVPSGTSVTLDRSVTVASGTSIRFGSRMPDGSIFSDIANLHVYPVYGGDFGSGPQYSAQSIDPSLANGGNFFDLYMSMNFGTSTTTGGAKGYTTAQRGLLRKWITEYGYSTTFNAPGAQSVTPAVQGKNNLTAWLNAFQYGFERFFIYELFDDAASPSAALSYGIYDFSGNPKVAATWLHNLVTILADTSINRTKFTPDSLQYTLAGMPVGGKSQLFQESNGTFFLVIWNNVSNWNVPAGTAIAVSGTNVTVTFGRSGTVTAYDPTIGTTAQQTISGNAVTVSLSDYPLVISFV